MKRAIATPNNPANAGTAIAVAVLPVCWAWPAELLELAPPEVVPEPPEPLLVEAPSGVVAVPSVDGVVVEPAVPLLTDGPAGAVDLSTVFARDW